MLGRSSEDLHGRHNAMAYPLLYQQRLNHNQHEAELTRYQYGVGESQNVTPIGRHVSPGRSNSHRPRPNFANIPYVRVGLRNKAVSHAPTNNTGDRSLTKNYQVSSMYIKYHSIQG